MKNFRLPKKRACKTFIEATNGAAVFDKAGKYGARLAPETIGNCLRDLDINQDDVIISEDDKQETMIRNFNSHSLGQMMKKMGGDDRIFSVRIYVL